MDRHRVSEEGSDVTGFRKEKVTWVGNPAFFCHKAGDIQGSTLHTSHKLTKTISACGSVTLLLWPRILTCANHRRSQMVLKPPLEGKFYSFQQLSCWGLEMPCSSTRANYSRSERPPAFLKPDSTWAQRHAAGTLINTTRPETLLRWISQGPKKKAEK